MSKSERMVAILTAGMFVATLVVYALDPTLPYEGYLRNAFYLVAPIAAVASALFVVRAYGLPSSHARNFLLIAIGLGLWLIGEALFIFYSVVGISPFPSIADIFYLLAYPLLTVGLWWESRATRTSMPLRDRITFYVAAALFTILVVYVGIVRVYDPSVPLLNNLIAMAYGLTDLVLILAVGRTVVLARTFRGGALAWRWFIIFSGLVCILLGDLLFAYFNVPYDANLQPYIFLDLLYIAGYFAFVYGFVSLASLLHRIKKRPLLDDQASNK